MNWVNAVLVVAVLLAVGVSNTVTWAVTRIRNARASHKTGHAIGYHEGFGDGEMSYAHAAFNHEVPS
jgi:hypothetical protein